MKMKVLGVIGIYATFLALGAYMAFESQSNLSNISGTGYSYWNRQPKMTEHKTSWEECPACGDLRKRTITTISGTETRQDFHIHTSNELHETGGEYEATYTSTSTYWYNCPNSECAG